MMARVRKDLAAALDQRSARMKGWTVTILTASSVTLSFLLLLPGFAQNYNERASRQKQSFSVQNNSNLNRGMTFTTSRKGFTSAGAPASSSLRRSRKPDAEAGVELLENIFNRVMNIPQVALTKSTTAQLVAQNLKQSNQMFNQMGQGVDYKLAIRPKESGKVFAAPSPSLQIATPAPSAEPSIAAGLSSGANSPFQGNYGTYSAPGSLAMRQQQLASLPSTSSALGRSSGRQSDFSTYGDEGQGPPPLSDFASNSGGYTNNQPETWRGGALSRSPKTEQAGADDKPGVWEDFSQSSRPIAAAPSAPSIKGGMAGSPYYALSSEQQHNGAGAGGGANYGKYAGNARALEAAGFEESKKKAPELASSVNRLYKLSKRLEEAQELSERAEKAQQQVVDLKSRVAQAKVNSSFGAARGAMNGLALADARHASANYYNAPRQVEILDERPIVRDFRESASSDGFQSGDKLDALSQRSRRSVPVSGLLMNKTKDAERGPAKAEALKEREKDADSGRKDKLALLPPNVVTGIPLGNVSLGKSEAQVISSLAQIGKLKQQKVKSWTVYSWSKKSGDGSDALQLYFRHGMLDAIRIFDSSLVGTDFGVSPGDRLEEVKERFGEPSFLLAEPGSFSGGKNYIYPISQVAFQLARTAESSPQVVSVLIFSVK